MSTQYLSSSTILRIPETCPSMYERRLSTSRRRSSSIMHFPFAQRVPPATNCSPLSPSIAPAPPLRKFAHSPARTESAATELLLELRRHYRQKPRRDSA